MAPEYLIFEDLKIGMRWSFRRTLTGEDMEATMALTGDQGGYHVDEAFAVAAGFQRLIVPGLLPASMFTKIGGNMNFLAREMRFTFLKPVYVGDTLEAEITITTLDPERKIATFEGTLTNQEGVTVLTCETRGHLPLPEWGVPVKPPAYFE